MAVRNALEDVLAALDAAPEALSRSALERACDRLAARRAELSSGRPSVSIMAIARSTRSRAAPRSVAARTQQQV